MIFRKLYNWFAVGVWADCKHKNVAEKGYERLICLDCGGELGV